MSQQHISQAFAEVGDVAAVQGLLRGLLDDGHPADIDELSELIADLEDPDQIDTILTATGSIEASRNEADSTASLSTLYQRYLKRRRNKSPATISQYKRTIPDFTTFASDEGITKSSGLTFKLVDQYIDDLYDRYDADATIITYTKNVRAWLEWLYKRNQCAEPLYQLLSKEELDLNPAARNEAPTKAETVYIIQQLRTQRRGSARHAIVVLLYNGGLRIGEVHSLDVRDVRPEDSDVTIRHRPEEGTRIKNGSEEDDTPGDGERNVELKPDVIEALQLYIDNERPDVTDEYGREPLFTTSQGRAASSTLRRWVYDATSCRWADETEPDIDCEGGCHPDTNVCPYSYYPHALRRGAIVNQLNGGLSRDRASERFDVSVPILKKHYDPRAKQKRKEQRAEEVRAAWSDF